MDNHHKTVTPGGLHPVGRLLEGRRESLGLSQREVTRRMRHYGYRSSGSQQNYSRNLLRWSVDPQTGENKTFQRLDVTAIASACIALDLDAEQADEVWATLRDMAEFMRRSEVHARGQ